MIGVIETFTGEEDIAASSGLCAVGSLACLSLNRGAVFPLVSLEEAFLGLSFPPFFLLSFFPACLERLWLLLLLS